MAWPPLLISETCFTLRNCIRATLSAELFAIAAPPSVYVGNCVDGDVSSAFSSSALDSSVVVAMGCGSTRGCGFGTGGATVAVCTGGVVVAVVTVIGGVVAV